MVGIGLSGPVSRGGHNGAFRLREEKDLTRKSLRSRGGTRRKSSFYLRVPLRDLRDFRVWLFPGSGRSHRETGRQQRTSGILELLRNRDERRPPLPTKELIARLGRWKGHRVGTVERFEAGVKGPRAQVWIDLLGLPQGHPRICSGCQRPVRGVHDWSPREIRDLPIFDADTILMVWRARVACPSCGPKLEALDWLEPYARVTCRLAESVARLCKVMPIKRFFTDLSEDRDPHW